MLFTYLAAVTYFFSFCLCIFIEKKLCNVLVKQLIMRTCLSVWDHAFNLVRTQNLPKKANISYPLRSHIRRRIQVSCDLTKVIMFWLINNNNNLIDLKVMIYICSL